VEVDLAVVVKELFDQTSLVGREVVEDDVNLLRGRALSDDFMEEGHEVLAGVAGCGFAVHATGGGFQRRIQGKRAMAVVLEAMAFGCIVATMLLTCVLAISTGSDLYERYSAVICRWRTLHQKTALSARKISPVAALRTVG